MIFHIDFNKVEQPRFKRPELLLHSMIPPSLHGLNPRTLFGKEWWDEQRKKAYAENNYCCWACGIHCSKAKRHQWLEAHEQYHYDWANKIAHFRGLVALCHYCHSFIHAGHTRQRYRAGKIPLRTYRAVFKQGHKLTEGLHSSDYLRPEFKAPGWKLNVGGKTYEKDRP